MEIATLYERFRAQGIPDATTDKFIENFSSVPAVWMHFERFTLAAIDAGKRLGAKCIMERVRWEVEVEESREFKVNNNYTAYYARVFAEKYPEHRDYFETREVRGLGESNVD